MRRYNLDEVKAALSELDAKLDKPTAMTLIGGAAVAMILDDHDLVTKDIDAFGASRSLLKLARTLPIPFDPAAIADLPWNFEDRCAVALQLQHLEVSVPNAHDLTLSKIARWSQSDENHVLLLHARQLLDYETLIVRYRTEMTHAVGDPRRLRFQFLQCVDTVFGAIARHDAASAIPEP